ncbi:hypothetical protein ACH5BF_06875 [Arcobacter sp. YIC-464]|uniref:hypothetical protein n=1 Tax=Arcobacter sp. YIC-464 TaxID=3376631 RepID=UPI003C216589
MKIESSEVNINTVSNSLTSSSVSSGAWLNELKSARETKAIKTTVVADLNGIYLASNDESKLSDEDKIKKKILEEITTKLNNDKETNFFPNENKYKNDEVNWGFRLQTKTEYQLENSIEFNTKAIIKTSNKDYEINLSISFSKSFYEVHEEQLNIGNQKFIDPLIINYKDSLNSFDNINPTLKFAFDLNSDGVVERIPLLRDGAGFLAIDKNSNKAIDSANELFGTKSGDGFKDLRAYDKDNNNWLDENDSIFKDLVIWEKNDKGDDKLISLSQAGIGAIYLGNSKTSFDYHQSIENRFAHLKQSSFFIKENGKTGLINGVDFII